MELTELSGCVENDRSSTSTAAFVNGKLFFVAESLEDRIHYVVDMQKNRVEILKKQPLEFIDQAVFNTYAVNEDEYAEVWVQAGNRRTHVIQLFDQDGNEKNVFEKIENSAKERFSYVLNDNKMYEYAQINRLSKPYVNIYDLTGSMLSSTYLPEVAAALDSDPETTVTDFQAFGNYFAVTVCIDVSQETYIYNTKSEFLLKLDECRCLPSTTNHTSAEKMC